MTRYKGRQTINAVRAMLFLARAIRVPNSPGGRPQRRSK